MNKEIEPINPNLVIDKNIVDMITKFYEQIITSKNHNNIIDSYNQLKESAINNLHNITILCDNELDAKQIAVIAHHLHFRWISGKDYIGHTRFDVKVKNFCYYLSMGTYGSADNIRENDSITLKSAEWFINNYKYVIKAMGIKIKK